MFLAFKWDIAYFTSDTILKDDGIFGQNFVNLLIPVAGFGSTRDNHNVELCKSIG